MLYFTEIANPTLMVFLTNTNTIRQALRLDDADSVDCLPNEEIFAELARMGYEKPSTKLTFFKAFFSAQWKLVQKQVQDVEDDIEDEDDNNEEDASNQGEIAKLDADEDVTLEDVDAEVAMDADVQGRLAESQEKVYHLDLKHAKKVLSMQDTDEAKPVKVEEVIKVVTATKLMTEVVTTAATTINVAQVPKASAPRKKKGSSQEERKVREYSHEISSLKEKTCMTYTDIRPIFEKNYNYIQAFLEKGKKEIEEEGSKRKSNSLEQRAAKKQRIDEEGKELKIHLQIVVNDDDDVFTEATPLALKMFLLVEKKYTLTCFTLEQMLNNLRLEVEEKSEMSLELLRLMRRHLQEGYIPE
nr:hypothetical protein [Tanacetum cinerariifolium]